MRVLSCAVAKTAMGGRRWPSCRFAEDFLEFLVAVTTFAPNSF
jgi:hypothetical protein